MSIQRKVHPLPLNRMTSDAAVFAQKASVLQGKFKGSGTAIHNGKEVTFLEECSFLITRKNPEMVVYKTSSSTRLRDKPLHVEMGILKVLNCSDSGNDSLPVEAGMTHLTPSIHERNAAGSLDTTTGTLVLESSGCQKMNNIRNGEKCVTGLRRVYRRQGKRLTYDQYLFFQGCEGMTHHLHCELLEIQD